MTPVPGLTSQYPALKYGAESGENAWDPCECREAIPFGIANFKLIPVSLFPLGREIVPTDQPFAGR
ncbi:hypothetical protein [Streptomyces sp. T028]|uniref:hypothetical protein n=1 Tax=Streptomyces sp. T028 TaxID=3394379 RepID=UPI003A871982